MRRFLLFVFAVLSQSLMLGQSHKAINRSTVELGQEDLSELQLSNNTLRPLPPVLIAKTETADFTREQWRLQWRVEDPIDFFLILPQGVKKPRAVMYLFSYPDDASKFKDNTYCRRMFHHGVAAVGFVSAMSGERAQHLPPHSFLFRSPESLMMSVHDVQRIIDYLASRPDLDLSDLGMFGQGSGGTVAVLSAAADSRIRVLDLHTPWADWPDWVEHAGIAHRELPRENVTANFLKQLEPLDPLRFLPELKSRRIQMRLVGNDENVPKEALAKLASSAPSSTKVIQYPNAMALWMDVSDGRLFDWINHEVSPSTASLDRVRAKIH